MLCLRNLKRGTARPQYFRNDFLSHGNFHSSNPQFVEKTPYPREGQTDRVAFYDGGYRVYPRFERRVLCHYSSLLFGREWSSSKADGCATYKAAIPTERTRSAYLGRTAPSSAVAQHFFPSLDAQLSAILFHKKNKKNGTLIPPKMSTSSPQLTHVSVFSVL